MTQVTQEFSALVLRKEKTRPQVEKSGTPRNTHGFQPYKARDRPVSAGLLKKGKIPSQSHKSIAAVRESRMGR